MQLQLESPHFEPDEKLVKLVRNKFDHLGKIYDRIHQGSVVLRKEKNDKQKYFSIEARLNVPGKALFASEKDETFETALNKLIDDLEHQLRKHKEELEESR